MGKFLWRTIIITVVHTWTLVWSEASGRSSEGAAPSGGSASTPPDPIDPPQVDRMPGVSTALPTVISATNVSTNRASSPVSSGSTVEGRHRPDKE